MPSLLFLFLYFSSLFALPNIPSLLLNEVAQSASGEDGLNAPLRLYNNEEYTKGYAYSQSKEESKRGSKGASKSGSKRGDKREEWIGFNTLSNDLSKPHEVINTLFHETSNQALHRSNEEYANNRGNSAESIFSLKNYANSNTNLTTSRQWNERENHRERLRGGGVLREGNSYNARAYLGEWEGRGERENLLPLLPLAIPAYEAAIAGVGVFSAYMIHRLIKEKAQKEGISLDESAKRLGVVSYELKVGDIVDLGNFSRRQKRHKDDPIYVDPKTEWSVEKDKAQHKGKWKLKDKQGKRKATLDENGKVVGK